MPLPGALAQLSQWTYQDSLDTWPWMLPLAPPNITQHFGWNYYSDGTKAYENGNDFGLTMGTDVTSLTFGTVLDTGRYGGGGVVSVKSTLPSIGPASVYYQHLDTIAVTPGQTVYVGTLIGTSGGQLSGGHMPSTSEFSSGQHIEVGINAPWGSPWDGMGANIDPFPWFQSLVTNGPPFADRVATINQTTQNISGFLQSFSNTLTGTSTPGSAASDFLGIEKEIDAALTFNPLPKLKPYDPSSGIDWTSILPWNWDRVMTRIGQNVTAGIQADIHTVQDTVFHNAGALMLRGILFLTGFVIFMAFLGHLISAYATDVRDDARDLRGLPTPRGGILSPAGTGGIPPVAGMGGAGAGGGAAEGAAGATAGGIETLAEAAPLALA